MRRDHYSSNGQNRLSSSLSTALMLGSAACLALLSPSTLAAGSDSHAMHHHEEADHSMHQMPDPKATIRTVSAYDVPGVTLTGVNGEKVSLRSELDKGPVMVNFIFTSCTTICPAMSATFSEVQGRLAKDGTNAHLVSISVDPEHDTPERLKGYASRFKARPGWQLLTGSMSDSIAVQRAFDAYRGDKMNHMPLTLLRASPKSPWVRIEGFANASDLVQEYRKVMPKLTL